MTLRVANVYTDIQQSGKHSGFPTTFISCASPDNRKVKKVSIEKVIGNVREMKNEHVCMAGIRPLAQGDAIAIVYELVNANYIVSIETDASLILDDVRSARSFFYTLVIRCPSSGRVEENLYENISLLTVKDELKFVIGDIEDYEFAKDIVKRYRPKAEVIFSPKDSADNKILKELSTWLIDDKVSRVRLSVPYSSIS